MPFEEILEFLSGPYSYAFFFMIMILCGLGFPFNSDLILIVCGSLSGIGTFNPYILILLGITGLTIGDSLMFLIGHYGGFRILKKRPFSLILKKERIWQAGRFIKQKGPFFIFLVRFIPGTRSVTIFTSGIFKMNYKSFVSYNFSALVLLVSILVMGGHIFFANIEEAKKHLPLVLGGMFIFAIILLLFYRVFLLKLRKTSKRTTVNVPTTEPMRRFRNTSGPKG